MAVGSAAREIEIEDNTDADNEYDGGDEDEFADSDGNPKLADALGKVLRMAKGTRRKKKSIVLSKAKLHDDDVNKKAKREACTFEIAPDPNGDVPAAKEEKEEDVKPDAEDSKANAKKMRLSKYEKLNRGRVIPSILGRVKEKELSRIATKGVVQLFNAVRQQQLAIEKKFSEGQLTEAKKEKIFKSIDRKAFMDALSGSVSFSSNIGTNRKVEKQEIKEEEEEEDSDDGDRNVEKSKWQVLRNDFMMGAKLKDWDVKEEQMGEESE